MGHKRAREVDRLAGVMGREDLKLGPQEEARELLVLVPIFYDQQPLALRQCIHLSPRHAAMKCGLYASYAHGNDTTTDFLNPLGPSSMEMAPP